jgi:hypothetical protein
MLLKSSYKKARNNLWYKIFLFSLDKRIYFYIYPSYWHAIFCIKKACSNNICYFSARPNSGAGIGHQISNWNAGYWFAKIFDLKFAHFPFATQEWEDFLGFGENEVLVSDLQKQGFKKIKLPLFDENKQKELDLIRKIISSYSNRRVVFMAEQDQSYHDQFGVMNDIKRKFYNSEARKKDRLLYSNDAFNIAIHIRRGDIVIGQKNKDPNLLMRWQDNEYFVNVLKNIKGIIKTDKQIVIYLISQGRPEDFKVFEQFENIHYCLDMKPQDSFLHMVYADLIITSKSSFSYKPALLNNGIKVSPRVFWHGYPDTEDWILAEENGEFVENH